MLLGKAGPAWFVMGGMGGKAWHGRHGLGHACFLLLMVKGNG